MKDTNDGIKLVLITDSTVLLIRNFSLNLKGKSKRIVVVISLVTVFWFSNLGSVWDELLPMPPAPVGKLQPSYQYDSNQTGNDTSLEFEQEVSDTDTSSNDMYKIILVQDDGILPGANGFPLNNNPRRRHPFGRPRMRGRGINIDPPPNIQGLGDIPAAPKVRSFTEGDTGLNARRGNRGDQCPAPEFDMKKQYENFMQQMSEKGYQLECSQERFNELSTNPQTGRPDEKSLIEAKGGLQGEAEGLYKNIRRPSNKAVDLDFEIDSSKGYTHVDYKTPIDFQDLADEKGIDVSNFPSLETVAYNMGKKIPPRKEEFCGLPSGPKTPDNVLHVVNLDLIRDSNQKQNMIDRVLKEAEEKSDNTVGIYFLNYL